MSQYREYTTVTQVTDDEIVLRSLIGAIAKQTVVARGGSEETDFKAAAWDHLQLVLANAPAASTSMPCSVVSPNKLTKYYLGDTFSTQATTIKVPTGNSGNIQFRFDPGAFGLATVVNGGSPAALADEDIITFADGDNVSLNISSAPASELFAGYLIDVETGQTIDSFQFMNTDAP